MSGLRILFVTHAYPRFAADAAGSFLHRLALGLRAGGCEVRVLAPSGAGLAAEEEIDRIPVTRFRYAPRGMESLAYTGTMAEQVLGSIRGKGALAGMLTAGSLAVRRAVRDFQPDIVHAHWWFPSGLLAVAGAGDTPLVTTLHGSDVRLARKVTLVHPLFRRTMARSTLATAVSSWLAGEARAMASTANITVAPMPADIELFTAERTERVPGRFLFVGRLNAQKGVGELLDALAWTAPHITLDVIGAGADAEVAALKARAERLGVAARVFWRSAVGRTELPAFYRRSQSLVVPSRNEGLGLVAVEAQLCQTPVIAYRSGGIPDVVQSDWGGTLVTPGDTRELAAAITSADARRAAIDGLGSTARARMLDRFAPSAVAARYRDLYRSVLADDR
jgi:glycosyltransferase involved in cell wall biosynthesis